MIALIQQDLTSALGQTHGGRIVKNTATGSWQRFRAPCKRFGLLCRPDPHRANLQSLRQKPRRIAFRVGVNIGDVIVEPNDIFGDGVNIAARLGSVRRTRRHLHLIFCLRSSPRQGWG